jgi:putative oxidoreductase
MTLQNIDSVWAARMLSILRIVAALMFWQHGLQKFFGFPAASPPRPSPVLFSLVWFAGLCELVLSPILAIGLFTRWVALLLSGEMAIAYWWAHASRSMYPIVNSGELAIMYCFVFLYIACAGAGPWSIDASRER